MIQYQKSFDYGEEMESLLRAASACDGILSFIINPKPSIEATERNASIIILRGLTPNSSAIITLLSFSPSDNDRCHCR